MNDVLFFTGNMSHLSVPSIKMNRICIVKINLDKICKHIRSEWSIYYIRRNPLCFYGLWQVHYILNKHTSRSWGKDFWRRKRKNNFTPSSPRGLSRKNNKNNHRLRHLPFKLRTLREGKMKGEEVWLEWVCRIESSLSWLIK